MNHSLELRKLLETHRIHPAQLSSEYHKMIAVIDTVSSEESGVAGKRGRGEMTEIEKLANIPGITHTYFHSLRQEIFRLGTLNRNEEAKALAKSTILSRVESFPILPPSSLLIELLSRREAIEDEVIWNKFVYVFAKEKYIIRGWDTQVYKFIIGFISNCYQEDGKFKTMIIIEDQNYIPAFEVWLSKFNYSLDKIVFSTWYISKSLDDNVLI